jgi:hypothetical protein
VAEKTERRDLVLLSQARKALAEAKTLGEVKAVRDQGHAAIQWQRSRRDVGLEARNEAAEIVCDAERWMGVMLAEMERQAVGRPAEKRFHDGTISPPTLSDLGLSKQLSHRCQLAKEVPEEKYRTWLAEKREAKREITSGELQALGRTLQKAKEKAATRKALAEEAAVAIPVAKDQGVKVGDFRELASAIQDASVDLIFTDPPYDRKSLPLYESLAAVASRVLRPGGSLICYVGQYQIPEVLDLVCPLLRYWWMLGLVHTGIKARMREYGVVVQWKPLLWFVKDTRGDKETFVDDLVISQMEKDTHDWQQSLIEAEYYIEKLCPQNGLVFDPFVGGGTTLVAAKTLKRRWFGCEIDEEAALIARKRVHDAQVR